MKNSTFMKRLLEVPHFCLSPKFFQPQNRHTKPCQYDFLMALLFDDEEKWFRVFSMEN